MSILTSEAVPRVTVPIVLTPWRQGGFAAVYAFLFFVFSCLAPRSPGPTKAASIEAIGARVTLAPDLPAVAADRALVLQVFLHLVENALKFGNPRSETRVHIGNGKGTTICLTLSPPPVSPEATP